jgi:hypothetical protein
LFGIVGELSQGSFGLFWSLGVSAIAGYPTAIFFGIPVHLVFRRYRIAHFIIYFAAGLALGLVAFLSAALPGVAVAVLAQLWGETIDPSFWIGVRGSLPWSLVSALCGGIASAAFWLIARPDRALSETNRSPNGARTRTLFAISICSLLAVWLTYLLVIRFQRELILEAVEDIKFYDGVRAARAANVIFGLPKGKSATIVRCEDRKSVIEPMIRLDDGRMAYLLSGRFNIHVKPTGMLSRPRYLGCPGY